MCLFERGRKKNHRDTMCDSHSPPQHRTLWKSILTDTGLSGANTDQHYWKQEEQVGPNPFCFTWVLLDRKRNLYELCFLELGLSWMNILFDGSWSTLVGLHWTHLRCRVLKHWPPMGLHCTCFNVCRSFYTCENTSRCSNTKSDWRLKEKAKKTSQKLTGKKTYIVFFH